MSNQTSKETAETYFTMPRKPRPPDDISGAELIRRAELEVEQRIAGQKAAREAATVANATSTKQQQGRPSKTLWLPVNPAVCYRSRRSEFIRAMSVKRGFP
jgi:hypothetical protein